MAMTATRPRPTPAPWTEMAPETRLRAFHQFLSRVDLMSYGDPCRFSGMPDAIPCVGEPVSYVVNGVMDRIFSDVYGLGMSFARSECVSLHFDFHLHESKSLDIVSHNRIYEENTPPLRVRSFSQ